MDYGPMASSFFAGWLMVLCCVPAWPYMYVPSLCSLMTYGLIVLQLIALLLRSPVVEEACIHVNHNCVEVYWLSQELLPSSDSLLIISWLITIILWVWSSCTILSFSFEYSKSACHSRTTRNTNTLLTNTSDSYSQSKAWTDHSIQKGEETYSKQCTLTIIA